MSYMFTNCYKLKQIKGIDNFNTINVTKMKGMFGFCKELLYLDLTNFNTSNVTTMNCMFYGCWKLKGIKGINNFNTINVNDFYGMFTQCKELEYLDLSNFNTSKVTTMEGIFELCSNLKQIIGINKIITNNVISMRAMFDNCKEIEYLDLSNFNTIQVTDMEYMFNECNKLKYIKGLNNFKTFNVIKNWILVQKLKRIRIFRCIQFQYFKSYLYAIYISRMQ